MNMLKLKAPPLCYGPGDNGILLSAREFDRADFEEGWRYELIQGVLIVTPIPLVNEGDPNEYLGYLLVKYEEEHPLGSSLNLTMQERTVYIGDNRRRADRVIWANLDRLPKMKETPTIVVEFVSGRKRDRIRDYQTKRVEYLKVGVKEYWVIDRFDQTMTVFSRQGRSRKLVVNATEVYCSDLLPGFELPLAKLLARANRWS